MAQAPRRYGGEIVARSAYTLPAPFKGINSRDPLDQTEAGYALRLDNMIPDGPTVELRRGVTEWATGLGGPVESIASFVSSSAIGTLVAACGGKMWDCSSQAPAVEIAGLSSAASNYWELHQYRNQLIGVNGVDQPVQLAPSGSTLVASAATYTGVPDDNRLQQGCVHRSRQYFIEGDSQSIWYSDVNAYTGALEEFVFGPLLRFGGSGLWVRSFGAGRDGGPSLVICTTEGEILIYAGDYPGNTWALVHQFKVAKPIGVRSCIEASGDILIITVAGVASLGALISGNDAYVSDIIKGDYDEAVRLCSSNKGWQGVEHEQERLLIINVPISEYTANVAALPTPDPVPQQDDYWSNMVEWADYLYDPATGRLPSLTSPADDGEGFRLTQYDALLGMHRLAVKYPAEAAKYYGYADEATFWYGERYVEEAGGVVPGYYLYPQGFAEDYLVRSTAASLTRLQLLLANGLFVNSNSCVDANGGDSNYPGLSDGGSREAAYSLKVFLDAVRCGEALTSTQVARRQQHFEWLLGHLDQWAVSKTSEYVRPFMVGLNAYSLIRYWDEVDKDARIVPLLQAAASYIIDTCWNDTEQAFYYTDRATGFEAEDRLLQPDLNMVVAPLFGWLYHQTGIEQYREWGDKIFVGGISVYDEWGFWVRGSFLGTRSSVNPAGKQYHQQLFWGPLYIYWAELPQDTESVLATRARSEQIVASGAAWTKFTNINATCLTRHNDRIYIGTDDGRVMEALSGQSDDGAAIPIDVKYAFSDFGDRNRIKHFLDAKPYIESSSDTRLGVDIDVDFADKRIISEVVIEGNATGTPWGSPWGSDWIKRAATTAPNAGLSGVGTFGALRLFGQVKNTSVKLSAAQVKYESGGDI